MNTQQFLQLHNIVGGINNKYSLNINCVTGSDYSTTQTATISEFTLTENTLVNFDPNSSGYPQEEDLITVLQQAEKVTLTAQLSASANIKVDLEITNKAKYKGISADRNYYYFAVKPIIIKYSPDTTYLIDKFTSNARSSLYTASLINFTPYLSIKNYVYSDYYPLINNAQDSRTSYIAQQSDRSNSDINPTNFIEILARTADPAAIQDSNYTATGWVNARYRGTNTSANNYKGVSPVTVGISYRGELNNNTVPDLTIYNKDLAQRTVEDLLYTGNSAQPLLPTYSVSKYKLVNNLDGTATTIEITINNNLLTEIKEGSILKITGTANIEYLRVVSKTDTSTNLYLKVERGYLNSTVGSYAVNGGGYTNNSVLYVVPADYSYKFTGTTSKTVRNSDSKIWIEATNEIIYTDKYGIIYSGSRAEYF